MIAAVRRRCLRCVPPRRRSPDGDGGRAAACAEQLLELIELYLPRPILVDLLDQVLDVDGHLKFVLNNVYQFVSVDRAFSVGLATHRYERL